LRSGLSQSCGCLKRELASARWRKGERPTHRTHGKSGTPEHVAWKAMIGRCTNTHNPRWHYYGGRGITVCDRWLGSFGAFLDDMGAKPSPKHSLDRIDNDGPYSPENCRWATRSQQTSNTRRNRYVTYNGATHTLQHVADTEGVNYKYLWRLHVAGGVPLDTAIAEVRAGRSR
jgi:hypothetical protein